MKNGSMYFKTQDETSLWVEIKGSGRPLILCHGWLASGRFFQKNVDELAKHFQVITMDFRDHGRSQKTLEGHTIDRYAQDLHEMILAFGLQDVILGGWSMGGSVVLSYWRQFGRDGRVSKMLLMDMSPYPYSDADWNSHTYKNYNVNGFHDMINDFMSSREQFLCQSSANGFYDGEMQLGSEWIVREMHSVPTWSAIAIYSNYLLADYTAVLPTVTIPTLVMGANSAVYEKGIAQGEHVASHLPRGEFMDFQHEGHYFFYENPQKFNQAVIDFGKK